MEITVKRGGGWVSQVGSSINPSQPPSLLSQTDITAREGEGGLNQSFLNERNSAMKYNTDGLGAIDVEQSFLFSIHVSDQHHTVAYFYSNL